LIISLADIFCNGTRFSITHTHCQKLNPKIKKRRILMKQLRNDKNIISNISVTDISLRLFEEMEL